MAFHDDLFPVNIAYGSRGGPGFDTGLIRGDSGKIFATARTENPIHTFDVSYGIRTWQDVHTIKHFYMARGGALNTFKFKDWGDYATTVDGTTHLGNSVSASDCTIGTGDVAGTTTFQLQKVYSSGSQTYNRVITKPVSGTVRVAVDSVSQTEGVDFTVNLTNGVITFTTAPSAGDVVTAGFEFYNHVRFGEETDAVLSISLDDFENSSIPAIIIEEETEDIVTDDDFFFRGSSIWDPVSSDVSVTLQDGVFLSFDFDASNRHVILPDPTNLPTGGPMFIIEGLSGTSTFDVDTHNRNEIISNITAGEYGWLFLRETSGGTKSWVGFKT